MNDATLQRLNALYHEREHLRGLKENFRSAEMRTRVFFIVQPAAGNAAGNRLEIEIENTLWPASWVVADYVSKIDSRLEKIADEVRSL